MRLYRGHFSQAVRTVKVEAAQGWAHLICYSTLSSYQHDSSQHMNWLAPCAASSFHTPALTAKERSQFTFRYWHCLHLTDTFIDVLMITEMHWFVYFISVWGSGLRIAASTKCCHPPRTAQHSRGSGGILHNSWQIFCRLKCDVFADRSGEDKCRACSTCLSGVPVMMWRSRLSENRDFARIDLIKRRRRG